MQGEFTTFYEAEAPRVIRSLTLACGEPGLAEDAVAEAFARAWSRWPQVRASDRPGAWVMRVALTEDTRYKGVDGADGLREGAPAFVVHKDGKARTVAQREHERPRKRSQG